MAYVRCLKFTAKFSALISCLAFARVHAAVHFFITALLLRHSKSALAVSFCRHAKLRAWALPSGFYNSTRPSLQFMASGVQSVFFQRRMRNLELMHNLEPSFCFAVVANVALKMLCQTFIFCQLRSADWYPSFSILAHWLTDLC